MESERGSLQPEASRSAHKPLQVWDRIDDPIKETDTKILEERGGDARKKRLQLSVRTSERNQAKVRKCDPRHDRRTQQFSLDVSAGIQVEGGLQYLQLRHKKKPD
jgi:hypothetical protein